MIRHGGWQFCGFLLQRRDNIWNNILQKVSPVPPYPLFIIILLFNASRSTLLGNLYSNNLTIKYPKDFDEI
jgi:hypothetical protein